MEKRDMPNILKTIDNGVGYILKGISVTMLTVLFILLLINVFSRYVLVFSMGWFDEIVELAFAYLVFFGAAALWRDRDHFQLEWLEDKIRCNPFYHGILRVLINILAIVFFYLLFKHGWNLMMRAGDTTPVIKMPKKVLYFCIPVSGFIMFIYGIRNLVTDLVSFAACFGKKA